MFSREDSFSKQLLLSSCFSLLLGYETSVCKYTDDHRDLEQKSRPSSARLDEFIDGIERTILSRNRAIKRKREIRRGRRSLPRRRRRKRSNVRSRVKGHGRGEKGLVARRR